MKVKPLQDWAVIKITDAKEKTAGGIVIPDTAKDKPSEGIVEAIGPGRYEIEKGKEKEKKKKFVPTVLKPGKRVIFLKYMTTEVEIDGEVITLVREEDILGTFEDDKDQLMLKKPYPVEVKEEKPPAVQEKIKKDLVPVGSSIIKKVAKDKIAAKKKPVSKTVKPAAKAKAKAGKKMKDKKPKAPQKAVTKKTVAKKKTSDVKKKTKPSTKKTKAKKTLSEKKPTIKKTKAKGKTKKH